jgi:flagellar basal-body rod protein FlgG
MMRSLWIAKSGMEAQQMQLDHISQNLANSGTNGYKQSHAVFEDLMYQTLRQSGANAAEGVQLPTGLQVGLGVRPVATSREFSQGNLQQTSNNLDVAIQGKGFFQVEMPDGTVGYTRDGSFRRSSWPISSTRRGWIRRGRTSSRKQRPQDHRWWATRRKTAWARCLKASWKRPM